MTTHVVATSAIHSFKSEAVLKNEVKKRNLFIAFSFAFFKSETLCIMHNEVYEEERELISPQIHISVLKLLQKNTSRELNGVVQAMFRSMLAQEDEAHVKLEQGLKIVKIFKEHTSKICILNDFSFYEVRQKTILEKKAKQQQNP
ncbi:hypothetical protein DY000_02035774 [Brassica cretica]|uniref:YTH domain-containing family protein n=1 Tax=Brassica cretica TaxID=69181 RepID=A0ABQ7DR60_BRACR|nr:hypothetical protein DY000_02035774 [Brassica cretica]